MRTLRRIPAVLAALLLAAHFLRDGDMVLMTAALGLAAVPFLPWRGAALLARLALGAGAAVWVITAWRLAGARAAAGQPAGRMLAILLSVAAFSLLAAALLPAPANRTASG